MKTHTVGTRAKSYREGKCRGKAVVVLNAEFKGQNNDGRLLVKRLENGAESCQGSLHNMDFVSNIAF